MQYNKGPSIIKTIPNNHENKVSVDNPIIVTFDKDISKVTISGNVQIIDRDGAIVECRYQYANREITVSPREPLAFNKTYTVIVRGDNNPGDLEGNKGILSPTGQAMLGDYSFSFTTIQSVMKGESIFGLTPTDIVLDCMPTLKGQTTTGTINPTFTVHIEISSSNTFDAGTLVWDGECDIETFTDGFKPMLSLFDGTYYWRARSRSNTVHANYGEWSNTAQFAIQTHKEATVVADDYVSVDVAFPSDWDMLEPSIIDVYPQANRSHVKTNLKTMTITYDKIVPEDMLQKCYVTLTGSPVDDDINSETHGNVQLTTSVIYDHENQTTTVVLSLPEIGGDK